MVELVITAPCALRGGARYNPGERVAFDPAVAQELLAMGVAALADEPEGKEETPVKAPDGPMWDKMVKGAPVKKGGVRP